MAVKDFLTVVKPGIVFGNAFAAVGGFFVGSPDEVRLSSLLGLTVGTVCVIAGSCVINNYLDRSLDARMRRTRKRPSVTGSIPVRMAMLYAGVLLAAGLLILLWKTNPLTAGIGALGALLYTIIYGYSKRKTHHGTFVGAFPGATPPLAGYVAATNQLDLGAWLVFAAMFAWQMPHFYAISIRRLEDYRAAGLPVLPAVKGLSRTVWEMRLYGLLFPLLCYWLAHEGYAGFLFGATMILISLYWLLPMFSPNWRSETIATAKEVFKRSLVVLLVFCIAMTLSHVLI